MNVSKIALLSIILAENSFAFVTNKKSSKIQHLQPGTQMQLNLFGDMKERSEIDADRETPIDRWMGWTSVSEKKIERQLQNADDFVDAMDKKNYVAVELSKPMGIVFEENDAKFGGINVQSMAEGGIASINGIIEVGDQLISVGNTCVSGFEFDEALNKIIECEEDTIKLVLFRGSAQQFYGPTGASKAWLEEFVSTGGVDANNKSDE